jgi:hypothetical protein
VVDAYGNVVTGYRGTIAFRSSDPTAGLPKNYTFTAADQGVHTFTGLVLKKKGNVQAAFRRLRGTSCLGMTGSEQVFPSRPSRCPTRWTVRSPPA